MFLNKMKFCLWLYHYKYMQQKLVELIWIYTCITQFFLKQQRNCFSGLKPDALKQLKKCFTAHYSMEKFRGGREDYYE